ncbi:TerC family protein [Prosthecomicrobium pneumaticum]|uniref:Tellurite resistance protein TerC n=1 Tax=Prosthecomicrobium pneumaticum TaxID=81895 RepID=A0A7W9FK55_9HYPH|nr:TerC family protein [Prosthecomicrobium pneumaticum]MBB5752427.1 tellurite resistance protein TerC [Prosthecomicrobium pneumaticum]
MDQLLQLVAADFLGKPVGAWLLFLGIVVALLVFDLGLFNRRDETIGVRKSLVMSAFYIAVALAFGAWVWVDHGREAGLAYLTGFVVEKSLALDNVFVISLIFAAFAIPRAYQHRVLFWGILGVLVLRGIMIAAGVALVENFDWILYVFGAFLVVTGVRMFFADEAPQDISQSRPIRLARRILPVSPELDGHHFFVRRPDALGRMKTFVTPLFLALVAIEFADVVFAVDSVPAIFAISTDPYIVYTSNIFAILGLRALYFALAAMVHRFHYLKYALALLLVVVGGKIFVNQIWGKVDPAISLGLTLAILAGGVLFSLWKSPPAGHGTVQPGASARSTSLTQ